MVSGHLGNNQSDDLDQLAGETAALHAAIAGETGLARAELAEIDAADRRAAERLARAPVYDRIADLAGRLAEETR